MWNWDWQPFALRFALIFVFVVVFNLVRESIPEIHKQNLKKWIYKESKGSLIFYVPWMPVIFYLSLASFW